MGDRISTLSVMEFVYVVKRPELFPLGFPHGFAVREAEEMAAFVRRAESRGFFVERRHAEQDASLKQIIPYCVLTRGSDVFVMRRLNAGGEARLHGKRSIGVGGHVNPVDDTSTGSAGIIEPGMRRELSEEVEIEGAFTARPVGLLNDDSTDVGSVHFGLVYAAQVSAAVRVIETDMLEGSFVPIPELVRLCEQERDTFETWSALIIDRIWQAVGVTEGNARDDG